MVKAISSVLDCNRFIIRSGFAKSFNVGNNSAFSKRKAASSLQKKQLLHPCLKSDNAIHDFTILMCNSSFVLTFPKYLFNEMVKAHIYNLLFTIRCHIYHLFLNLFLCPSSSIIKRLLDLCSKKELNLLYVKPQILNYIYMFCHIVL